MNTATTQSIPPLQSAADAVVHAGLGRRARPRLVTMRLAVLLASSSAYGFAFSAFVLLPKFLVVQWGAGPAEVGRASAAFGIATVLVCPLVGRWIDRVPRVVYFRVGAALGALASAVFCAIDEVGIALYAVRALQGVSFAMVMASVGALVADSTPRERLSQAVGLSGASMLVMNAGAPALLEPMSVVHGWTVVFAVSAAAATLAFVGSFAIRESYRPSSGVSRVAGLSAVLRQRVFADYAIVVALSAVPFGALFTFVPPFVLELGGRQVGAFFVAYALAATGVRLVAGSLPDRLGRRRVALWSLALYAAVPLGMLFAPLTGMISVGVLFGLAHGVFHPAMNGMALECAAQHERGRVMTLFTAAFTGGAWASSGLLGALAAAVGYPAVFLVGSLVCWLGVLFLAGSSALREADDRVGLA